MIIHIIYNILQKFWSKDGYVHVVRFVKQLFLLVVEFHVIVFIREVLTPYLFLLLSLVVMLAVLV